MRCSWTVILLFLLADHNFDKNLRSRHRLSILRSSKNDVKNFKTNQSKFLVSSFNYENSGLVCFRTSLSIIPRQFDNRIKRSIDLKYTQTYQMSSNEPSEVPSGTLTGA